MPATYEPIATTTLGSATATITFSSIPNTYTDLKVILFGKMTSAANAFLTINSDTGNNYFYTRLTGDGIAPDSAVGVNQIWQILTVGGLSASNNGLIEIDLFSYANSSRKSYLIKSAQDDNGGKTINTYIALWQNTSVINNLQLKSQSTFAIGTTATLYGIKAA